VGVYTAWLESNLWMLKKEFRPISWRSSSWCWG